MHPRAGGPAASTAILTLLGSRAASGEGGSGGDGGDGTGSASATATEISTGETGTMRGTDTDGGTETDGETTDTGIFQIAQDLTLSNGIKVTLTGGALPENGCRQV